MLWAAKYDSWRSVMKGKIAIFIVLITLVTSKIIVADDFSIMEFSNPYKYDWTDETARLEYREDLLTNTSLLDEYSQLKHSPLSNALRTAVAPGWGHFSLGSHTKGQIFLVAQLALLGSSIYYYEKSMIHYRKYKSATQIDEMNEHYNEALLPYRQSNLLFGLFVVVWGYTIYDVINETNDYNWNRWNELTGEENNFNLSITPNGISLRF